MYSLLLQGEIYGLETGIDTKLTLWEFSKSLKTKELDAQYLIGIGEICLEESRKEKIEK